MTQSLEVQARPGPWVQWGQQVRGNGNSGLLLLLVVAAAPAASETSSFSLR